MTRSIRNLVVVTTVFWVLGFSTACQGLFEDLDELSPPDAPNGDGETCESVDLNCEPHGVCRDDNGAPFCECDTGYTGPECGQCASGFYMDEEECVPTGENECGGTEPLEGIPEEPCQNGEGTWQCDGEDAVECVVVPEIELRPATDGCPQSETSCSLSMTVGEELSLAVQILQDGDPMESQSIAFELEFIHDAQGATLTSSAATTDDEGIASVDLHTGDLDGIGPEALGQVQVEAKADEFDSPPQFTFHIDIEAPDTGAYIVDFTHQGDATFDRVRTATFADGADCVSILADYFEYGDWMEELQEYPAVEVQTDEHIPIALIPDLTPGDEPTVAAIAEKDVGDSTVHYGFGCVDETRPVEPEESTSVEMPLFDHLPRFQDQYEMTHQFDLDDSLPQAVVDIILLWMQFGDDPTSFLLGCPADQDHCDESQGLFDLAIQSNLELEEETINTIEAHRSHEQGWNVTSDVLTDLMEQAEGDAIHSWAMDGYAVEHHLLILLESFRATGTFSFDGQPAFGLLDDQTVGHFDAVEYRWEEVLFRWGDDCASDPNDPDCVFVPVPLDGTEISGDAFSGEFPATVTNHSSISIDEHLVEAEISYAEFLFAAIDRVAPLHMTHNGNASDLSEVFAQAFDCGELYTQMYDQGLDHPAEAAQALCEKLAEDTSEILYQYVRDESEDKLHFNLQSPEENPCELHLLESYSASDPDHPFPILASFGTSDNWCQWQIDFIPDTPGLATGDFHGEASP